MRAILKTSTPDSSICSSYSESDSIPRPNALPTANTSSSSAQKNSATAKGATASSSPQPGSLESVHVQSQQISIVPPDSGHASEEKIRNIGKQSSLTKLGKVELSISNRSKELKQARDKNDQESIDRIQKELGPLQTKKKELSEEIRQSRSHSLSRSASDDEDSANSSSDHGERDLQSIKRDIARCENALKKALDENKEKAAEKIDEKLKSLKREKDEHGKNSKGGSVSKKAEIHQSFNEQFGSHPVEVYIAQLREIIERKKERVEDAKAKLAEVSSEESLEESSAKAIAKLESVIIEDTDSIIFFSAILRTLEEGAQASSETGIDGKEKNRPSGQNVSVAGLIRTVTKRRRSSMPPHPPISSSSSNPTPLQRMHGQTTKSGVLFPEDLKPHVSDKALQKIEDLDEQIEGLTNRVDRLLRNRAALNADRRDELSKLSSKLGSLIIEREKLEGIALPEDHILSAKQRADQYAALLNGVKSEETLALEEIFKQERSKHEREFDNSWSAFARQMLAGPLAFGTSFFVGNSIARMGFPGASFVGSLVSGTLHVVPATPVLKQVLAKSWTAPGLAEFNNYMKLQGASWGDWWRGETEVKKYESKDPNDTGRLTIAERLKQERAFKSILWDRFITEEAPYFSYTINYAIKALGIALGAPYFASGSAGATAVEWGAHSIAGFASGAETVIGIQFMRSLNPQAKEVVTPSRKVFEAEADMLDSLLADLNKALKDIKRNPPADPGDTTEKELLKAIHKTQKAAAAARTKSEFLGIFKYEFMEAFATPEGRADTLSEMLGRIISVLPIATASLLVAEWRKSGNPWQAFAAHAIPALVLMTPTLGWTFRPLYAGFIRALAQMCMNGSAKHMAAGAAKASVTTDLQGVSIGDEQEDDTEQADNTDSHVGSASAEEDADTRIRIHDHKEDEDSVVSESASERDKKTKKPSTKEDASESLVEVDDDEWHGNPNERDALGGW